MNELLIIIGICFYISIGYAFLTLFNLLKDKTLLEKIPYSFAIGLGFISMQMFSYSLTKVQWSLASIIIPWLVLIILVLIKKRKELFKRVRVKAGNLSGLEILFGALILLLLIFVCFEAILRPLSAWDGWAIWILKGKIFYIDNYINPNVYTYLKDNYAYIINLAVTFLYKVIGQADDRAVLLLFYSFYFMLGLTFYNAIRNRSGRIIALMFTFLLLSTQNLIRHGGRFEAGYADLALGLYVFLSSMILLDYLSTKNMKVLFSLIVLMAITSLVKEEGMFFSLTVLFIVIYHAIKNNKRKHVFIALLYLIPLIVWQGFKITNGIQFHYLYDNTSIHIVRLLDTVKYVFYELVNIKNWNFLWIVFFISLFLTKTTKETKVLYVIIAIQLAFYIGVFLISPHSPQQHVSNVMDRLLLHVAPLAVFALALNTCRIFKN